MTTKETDDLERAVYNPKNQPLEGLPTIYGFKSFSEGVLITQEGEFLGSHLCSSESYMLHDLGVLKGSRPDRHKTFMKYYPNGYKMEFVSQEVAKNHTKFQTALRLWKRG